MNKKEFEETLKKMIDLQNRVNPIIARFLERTLEEHGTEASVSVASYIATNMLAFCILVIEDSGGDPDIFMHLVLKEIASKHHEGRANADALRAIGKASITSGMTCRPRC